MVAGLAFLPSVEDVRPGDPACSTALPCPLPGAAESSDFRQVLPGPRLTRLLVQRRSGRSRELVLAGSGL